MQTTFLKGATFSVSLTENCISTLSWCCSLSNSLSLYYYNYILKNATTKKSCNLAEENKL